MTTMTSLTKDFQCYTPHGGKLKISFFATNALPMQQPKAEVLLTYLLAIRIYVCPIRNS